MPNGHKNFRSDNCSNKGVLVQFKILRQRHMKDKRGVLLLLFSGLICLAEASISCRQGACSLGGSGALEEWDVTAARAALMPTKHGFAMGRSLITIMGDRSVTSGGYYSKEW